MADKQADKQSEQVEAQKAADDAAAKGYIGVKVDPEPNESYTVAGQVGGTAKAPKDSGGNK